jgi:regulator of protease activity HflC (stomatin/prohibitin superfamily)
MGFLGILGIVIVLYILVSMRVLRQYERGVVFLLGKSPACAHPGLVSFSSRFSR